MNADDLEGADEAAVAATVPPADPESASNLVHVTFAHAAEAPGTPVKLDGVSKIFCADLLQSSNYALWGMLDPTQSAARRTQLRPGEFFAIENISMEVGQTETLGVLGFRRSGKSTFANIIGGLYPPDRGAVHVKGSSLLLNSIGGGFRPMLSVWENTLFRASLLGAPREGLQERCREAIAFAGLTDLMEKPLFNLDPDHLRQLGLAIALHVEAEILVIDEILTSGGDEFRSRALPRLIDLINARTTVLITRSRDFLADHSDRIMVLYEGRCEFIGSPQEAILRFEQLEDMHRAERSMVDVDVDLAAVPLEDSVDDDEDADDETGMPSRKELEWAKKHFKIERVLVDGEVFDYGTSYWLLRKPGEQIEIELEITANVDCELDEMVIGLHRPYDYDPISAQRLKAGIQIDNAYQPRKIRANDSFTLNFSFPVPNLLRNFYGLAINLAPDTFGLRGFDLHKILIFRVMTDFDEGSSVALDLQDIEIRYQPFRRTPAAST